MVKEKSVFVWLNERWRGYVSIDGDVFLVTDFVNLKIKSAQSFTHRGRVCIFIEVSDRMCKSICICTVFLKIKMYDVP
jgi:hypothetical protein